MTTQYAPLTRPQPTAGDPHAATGARDAGLPRRLRWIMVSVVAVAVAAVIVVSAFSVASTSSEMHDQLNARTREAAELSAGFAQDRWGGLADMLEANAKRPELIRLVQAGDAGHAALTTLLTDIQVNDPTLTGLSVLTSSGRLLAATVGEQFLGADFSSRDYYQGVIRTGKTYVSHAYKGARGDLLANVITPITTRPGGGPIGYLNAGRSLTDNQVFLVSFAASAGVEVTITDQSGATVAATDNAALAVVGPAHHAWLTPALRGQNGTRTITTPAGKAVVSYQHTSFGWIAAAQLRESTITEPLSTLRTTTILLAGTLVLLVITGGFLLYRTARTRERQLRADYAERARIAREVNDTLVQGLVAAQAVYDLGRPEQARDLLGTTLRHARDWIGDLLLEAGGLQPGATRRSDETHLGDRP